jgi:trafficking protein particle complex subunit 5
LGHKVLELQCWREKQGKGDGKRFTRLIDILTFISSSVWKNLFGKAADSLERSTQAEDEYMIMDAEPVTNTFISVPPDMGNLNCAAYIAGIVAGILDSAGFPATVTAVTSRPEDGSTKDSTVFLIKFSEEVMDREQRLG